MRGKGGRRRHGAGHDRGEYARTTITVPCDLKHRMKAVDDDVNWSAVACTAFDAKLRDLALKEEVENLDQVVERLRKLTAEHADSEEHHVGVESGKHWAMNRATPSQLASLESFRTEVSDSEWRELLQHREGIKDLTKCLIDEPGRGRGRRFWRGILDRKPESSDFFVGFAVGALEIWKAVKDRI